MPLYFYEAADAACSCGRCRDGFETMQHLDDARIERCPECGAPVVRLVRAPALGHSKTDLHYRAKRAGFTALKRVDKGTYERMY